MVAGKDLLIGRLKIVHLHKVNIPRLRSGCFVLQKHHLQLPQALAALQYEVVVVLVSGTEPAVQVIEQAVHVIEPAVQVTGTEILSPAEHLISIGSGLTANQSDTDISTPVLASILLTASQDAHTIVVVTSCSQRRVIIIFNKLELFAMLVPRLFHLGTLALLVILLDL